MPSALICHSLMSGCFNTNDALSSAKACYALWCLNITETMPFIKRICSRCQCPLTSLSLKPFIFKVLAEKIGSGTMFGTYIIKTPRIQTNTLSKWTHYNSTRWYGTLYIIVCKHFSPYVYIQQMYFLCMNRPSVINGLTTGMFAITGYLQPVELFLHFKIHLYYI